MISTRFVHGAGDCANFAHQIPLYIRRGHAVEIECTPDKAPMFQAAGATIVSKAQTVHQWGHAPQEQANHYSHWAGNKSAWNISKSPMPNIGSVSDLWEEYSQVRLNLDQFITPAEKDVVLPYIDPLPRPLILTHFQGNTGQGNKNIDHALQKEILQELLQSTDGTIINLDWDDRVYRHQNYRVRHLTDDWQRLSLIELYVLIQAADLVMGVDSGVLHFARFSDTPSLGLWTKNYPSHYALPRDQGAHLVGSWGNQLTRLRRIPFNIVEGFLNGANIAEQARRMIAPTRYLDARGPDLLLQSLIDRTRLEWDPQLKRHVAVKIPRRDNLTAPDRNKSFDLFLRGLRRMNSPTILETGTIRAEDDFSAGFATYLFGLFLKYHGGKLTSVELDANNVNFAKTWTTGLPVDIVHQHSHDYLKAYSGGKFSACYLDSHDSYLPGHEENCLEEARLVLPYLADGALMLIDDTPWHDGRFHGKGAQAVPWLLSQGWRVGYAGYQVLLSRN